MCTKNFVWEPWANYDSQFILLTRKPNCKIFLTFFNKTMNMIVSVQSPNFDAKDILITKKEDSKMRFNEFESIQFNSFNPRW